MTLWDQILIAPLHVRERILSQYGENFPLEVRCYFAKVIEEKIFADNSNETDQIFEQIAHRFFDKLLFEMNARIPDLENIQIRTRLADAIKFFQQQQHTYGVTRMYANLRNCLYNEKQLIYSNVPLTEHSFIPNEEHFQVDNDIRVLKAFVVERIEELTKKIDHDYELYVFHFNDFTKPVNHIDQIENDQKQEIIERRKAIEYSFNQILHNLQELEPPLDKALIMTKSVLNKVLTKFLVQWKANQCLAGNGARFGDTLNILQNWFENLAEIIWCTREQIRIAKKISDQLQTVPSTGLQTRMAEALTLLSSLITSSFVIEKQPPQVMKTNTRFTATVRLLIGKKLDAQLTQPLVKVSIVSEAQAQMIATTNKPTDACSGEILNNTSNMEYSSPQNTFTASFRNMQLKKIKRAEKKGTESVMDEKFALLFQTNFNVGHGDLVYSVWVLSLPVVVIVHGNQEPQSWATITWDNAFAVQSRIPFQVPDKVPWPRLVDALNTKFAYATEKPLSEMNLLFLCEKAFKQPVANPNQMEITWSMFCKEPIPERTFTFWEWFFAIMRLTREHLRNLWKDDRIMGFVHKKQAEEMLLKCSPGTFLLRFSDSELGGVTIAFVGESPDGQQQVIMLQPFSSKDFQIRSLADRIQDLHQLITLYPDIPKDIAFGQYYTPLDQPRSVNHGYVRSTLVTQVPGVGGGLISNPNTPQHSFMQSPDHIRDTPSVQSSYGQPGGQVVMDMGYSIPDDFSFENIDYPKEFL